MNPETGRVRVVNVTLPEPVAQEIEREARKTGKSFAAVLRERLAGAA